MSKKYKDPGFERWKLFNKYLLVPKMDRYLIRPLYKDLNIDLHIGEVPLQIDENFDINIFEYMPMAEVLDLRSFLKLTKFRKHLYPKHDPSILIGGTISENYLNYSGEDSQVYKYNYWRRFFFYPDYVFKRPFWPRGHKGPLKSPLMLLQFYQVFKKELSIRKSISLLLSLCQFAQKKLARYYLFLKLCFCAIFSHAMERVYLYVLAKRIKCIPLHIDKAPLLLFRLMEHYIVNGPNFFSNETFFKAKSSSSRQILRYSDIVLHLNYTEFILQWYHLIPWKRALYNEYIESNSFLYTFTDNRNLAWVWGKKAFVQIIRPLRNKSFVRKQGHLWWFLWFTMECLSNRLSIVSRADDTTKLLKLEVNRDYFFKYQYTLISHWYIYRILKAYTKTPLTYHFENVWVRLSLLFYVYIISYRVINNYFHHYNYKIIREDFTNFIHCHGRILLESENFGKKWFRLINGQFSSQLFLNMLSASASPLKLANLLSEFLYFRNKKLEKCLIPLDNINYLEKYWFTFDHFVVSLGNYFDSWLSFSLRSVLNRYKTSTGSIENNFYRRSIIYQKWINFFVIGFFKQIPLARLVNTFFYACDFVHWKFYNLDTFYQTLASRCDTKIYLKKLEIDFVSKSHEFVFWTVYLKLFKAAKILIHRNRIRPLYLGRFLANPNSIGRGPTPITRASAILLKSIFLKIYASFFKRRMSFLFYHINFSNLSYNDYFYKIYGRYNHNMWLYMFQVFLGASKFKKYYTINSKHLTNIQCHNRFFSNFSDVSRDRWAWISHRLFRCGFAKKDLPIFPDKGVDYIAILSDQLHSNIYYSKLTNFFVVKNDKATPLEDSQNESSKNN